MLDITSVFVAIKDQFLALYDWMCTHGIKVGGLEVSWFVLFLTITISAAILSALIPWYHYEEDE